MRLPGTGAVGVLRPRAALLIIVAAVLASAGSCGPKTTPRIQPDEPPLRNEIEDGPDGRFDSLGSTTSVVTV